MNKNKNKNNHKKFGFYKGSKLFSVSLILVSALLCGGLLYAANMYYDIDANKIIVDQVQRIIQNLEVTGTTYLGDGGTTNYAQISTTGDISFIGDSDLITKAAAGAEDDLTVSVTGAYDASLVLSSTGTGADALQILATTGGIDILASGAAAGEDIDIIATGSSVNINSTENVADSIVISSSQGGIDIMTNSTEDIDISATGGLNLSSSEAADGAITISTSNAAGQIYISSADTTADAIDLDSSGGIDIDAVAGVTIDGTNFLFTPTGTYGVNATGAVTIDSDGSLTAGGAGITITSDGANTFTLSSAGTGATGFDIDATAGGIDIDVTSDNDAEDFSVTVTGVDGGDIVLNSGDDLDFDAADNITLNTADGSITLVAAGATNGDLVFTVADNYTLTVTGDASNIITGTYDIDATGVITIDSDGNLVMGGSEISITSDGGNITIDTGSGTLQVPSGRISVVNGAVLTEPGQLVLREIIPIFGFDLPAQTASTSYMTISRTLENYPFPAALSTTTRIHKLVFRYSASTSAAIDYRIYNVDDSTTTASYTLPIPGSNDIDKGNAYVATTTIPSSVSSHKNWRIDVQTPDVSSTVRIFQIFLAAYDQLPQ